MNKPLNRFYIKNDNAIHWSAALFHEVFDFLSSKPISRDQLNYEAGVCKNIHYGDILTKLPSIVEYNCPILPYVNSDIDTRLFSSLNSGDIVIADTAEDYMVGATVEVSVNDGEVITAGLHTMACRPKIKFAKSYLGYYLNSPAFHNQLKRLVTGTKVLAINKSEIINTVIKFPSFEEQQKIAEFFTALDEKIELSIKKHNLFSSLKKAYASAVFDCLKDCRKLTIGDFANTFAGATPSTSKKEFWENGAIPWMSSGEIKKRYIHSVEKNITQSGYDNSSTKWVRRGTTLIAIAGQGSTRGKVAFTEIDLCTNQSLVAIECDNNIVLDKFLFFFLETQYGFLRSLSDSGGGRGGLNLGLINGVKVPIPSLNRQREIIKLFEIIDRRIDLINKKISLFELQKKAFMQRMFV